jgi:hypothetical protein
MSNVRCLALGRGCEKLPGFQESGACDKPAGSCARGHASWASNRHNEAVMTNAGDGRLGAENEGVGKQLWPAPYRLPAEDRVFCPCLLS